MSLWSGWALVGGGREKGNIKACSPVFGIFDIVCKTRSPWLESDKTAPKTVRHCVVIKKLFASSSFCYWKLLSNCYFISMLLLGFNAVLLLFLQIILSNKQIVRLLVVCFGFFVIIIFIHLNIQFLHGWHRLRQSQPSAVAVLEKATGNQPTKIYFNVTKSYCKNK